jgi:hypothetical protein
MPIDTAKALADLDRLIEGIGAAQSEESVQSGGVVQFEGTAQAARSRRKPIDFGQFGQKLDSRGSPLSNDKRLIEKEDSDFGQFGQQNSENEHVDPDLTDFDDFGGSEQAHSTRARVDVKSTVQIVQTVQTAESSFPSNDLDIGQSLDSGEVTVQNPPGLYRALPGAADADEFAERAALIEFGAEVPREWAEGFAALAAMPPPTGFWPDRWQRIIDAAGHFLDSWAGDAARLGWTTYDAFGCHDTAPAARFDCKGLVMLLDRYRIVSIDERGADLATESGARQRFYRRPMPPGTTMLWELHRRP